MKGTWPTPKQEMQLTPVSATPSDMKAVRYHTLPMTLFVSVLVQLIAAATLIALPAQDAFDQLFARTAAKRGDIHSIRARFTETTSSSLLERPVVSHGTVLAAPPARVLMTYTDPERRTVVIDGKSLLVTWPDRSERVTLDISTLQKRIDQYFTHARPEQLRSMFDISLTADDALRTADRIEMRPKRKQIKEGLEQLVLWIDRDSLLLVQLRMVFPGGDTKIIRLDEVVVNTPVPDNAFQIRP
jgi:outer membrane lipoprotein-sorting protein